MNFVPEDGTGLSSANSFTTVAVANDYLSTDSDFTFWYTDLGDQQKEYLLIRATEMLDNMVGWYGTRKVKTSGTSFPREDLPLIDGVEPPEDEVPTPVQRATARLAATLYSSDPFEERDTAGFTQIEIDTISLEIDRRYRKNVLPAMVRLLLGPYGDVPSVGGPRFGRVLK